MSSTAAEQAVADLEVAAKNLGELWSDLEPLGPDPQGEIDVAGLQVRLEMTITMIQTARYRLKGWPAWQEIVLDSSRPPHTWEWNEQDRVAVVGQAVANMMALYFRATGQPVDALRLLAEDAAPAKDE